MLVADGAALIARKEWKSALRLHAVSLERHLASSFPEEVEQSSFLHAAKVEDDDFDEEEDDEDFDDDEDDDFEDGFEEESDDDADDDDSDDWDDDEDYDDDEDFDDEP